MSSGVAGPRPPPVTRCCSAPTQAAPSGSDHSLAPGFHSGLPLMLRDIPGPTLNWVDSGLRTPPAEKSSWAVTSWTCGDRGPSFGGLRPMPPGQSQSWRLIGRAGWSWKQEEGQEQSGKVRGRGGRLEEGSGNGGQCIQGKVTQEV